MAEITVAAVTYGQMPWVLPSFVYSVLAQTDSRWKLIVAHDGPSIDGTREFMESIIKQFPDKVRYFETSERENCYGHNLRDLMIPMVDTEYLLLTNGDNLICHTAVSRLLASFDKGQDWDVIHFPLVHSHFKYTRFKHRFAYGCCDISQFIIKSEMAKKVGFRSREFAADGVYIEHLKTAFPNMRLLDIEDILVIHH